jgi:parvulin-like peptidyl-prolyl isomerase
VALALPVLMLLAACAGPNGDVAATVGGVEISSARVERDSELFTFLLGLSGGTCGTPVAGEREEAACARFALANDISEEIVKAYAAERDLEADPVEVAEAIGQLEASLGGVSALDLRLEEARLTRADLTGLARRLILFNAVRDDVVAERVDDELLRASYEQQLPTFTTIEVAHILVETRADAERIAAEVTPETFAEVAERESIDRTSAESGGSLGSYSQAGFESQFIPVFAEAALALEVGEISAPVRSRFGWHVISLLRRDVAAFEDVRDQLRAEQAGPVFEAWFRERIEATRIEVNPRFGRYDLETLFVVPIRSTAEEPTGPTGP